MAKSIKFNLNLSGKSVSNLDELQEHFSAEILPIYHSGRLLKWLQARELNEQVQALQAITPSGNEIEQMETICRVLDLNYDLDVLKFLIEDWQAEQQAPAVVAASSSVQPAATATAAAVDEEDADTKTTASAPAVDWSDQRFDWQYFKNEDFRNGKFVKAVFHHCDLSGANFSKADLTEATFYECNLTSTKFKNSNLAKTRISSSRLDGAIFDNASMIGSRINLYEECLTSFANTDLSDSVIGVQKSYELNFSKSILRNAAIEGDFFMANFEGADLSFSQIMISANCYTRDRNIRELISPTRDHATPFSINDFIEFMKTNSEMSCIFMEKLTSEKDMRNAILNKYVQHAININKTRFTGANFEGSKIRSDCQKEYTVAYQAIQKMSKALCK